jgi:phosphatidylglycerophosphatase A
MNLAKFACTLGGTGLVKKMPGTAGSFVSLFLAVPLLLFTPNLLGFAWFASIGIATLAVFAYAKNNTNKDPQEIVIDELCGMWCTMFYTFWQFHKKFAQTPLNWVVWLVVCFLVFRIFDIFKPFPIRQIEQKTKENPFSIILDDIIAGVMGAVLINIIMHLL